MKPHGIAQEILFDLHFIIELTIHASEMKIFARKFNNVLKDNMNKVFWLILGTNSLEKHTRYLVYCFNAVWQINKLGNSIKLTKNMYNYHRIYKIKVVLNDVTFLEVRNTFVID